MFVGFCNCSMFCCAPICVYSSFAITLMGKKELIALFCFVCLPGVFLLLCGSSSPQVCLQLVIVVFPDHTSNLLFWTCPLRMA